MTRETRVNDFIVVKGRIYSDWQRNSFKLYANEHICLNAVQIIKNWKNTLRLTLTHYNSTIQNCIINYF